MSHFSKRELAALDNQIRKSVHKAVDSFINSIVQRIAREKKKSGARFDVKEFERELLLMDNDIEAIVKLAINKAEYRRTRKGNVEAAARAKPKEQDREAMPQLMAAVEKATKAAVDIIIDTIKKSKKGFEAKFDLGEFRSELYLLNDNIGSVILESIEKAAKIHYMKKRYGGKAEQVKEEPEQDGNQDQKRVSQVN